MIKNISAWKISSLNEYSVQIRLGSNLGGFFFISGRRRMPMAEKVDQMDPDEKMMRLVFNFDQNTTPVQPPPSGWSAGMFVISRT